MSAPHHDNFFGGVEVVVQAVGGSTRRSALSAREPVRTKSSAARMTAEATCRNEKTRSASGLIRSG